MTVIHAIKRSQNRQSQKVRCAKVLGSPPYLTDRFRTPTQLEAAKIFHVKRQIISSKVTKEAKNDSARLGAYLGKVVSVVHSASTQFEVHLTLVASSVHLTSLLQIATWVYL